MFLRQLAVLGVGLGGAWWLRERYFFPKPTVEFAGGRHATPWLPLPASGDLIELSAKLAGLPISVVVDSGAQFSAIDRRLAERLGLNPSPIPLLAFGVSGGPTLTHTVSLDLALPGVALVGMRAATLELLTLSDAIRRPFAMLLGRDVLQALTADVDWPRGRVRFLSPEAFIPQAGAVVAPTTRRSGALMTSVSIEGAAPIELMVDTGATSQIALSQGAAEKLGLLSGRRVATGRSVSLGGVGQDRIVRVDEVVFAGRKMRDVEIQVFTPTVHGPIPDGLLGAGILRRYRVGLDLSAGVLWLSGPQGPALIEAPPLVPSPV